MFLQTWLLALQGWALRMHPPVRVVGSIAMGALPKQRRLCAQCRLPVTLKQMSFIHAAIHATDDPCSHVQAAARNKMNPNAPEDFPNSPCFHLELGRWGAPSKLKANETLRNRIPHDPTVCLAAIPQNMKSDASSGLLLPRQIRLVILAVRC